MKFSLRLMEIPRAKLYIIVYPNSSQNRDILNYNWSFDHPGRSILAGLILRIASRAGQYGKIMPS